MMENSKFSSNLFVNVGVQPLERVHCAMGPIEKELVEEETDEELRYQLVDGWNGSQQ